MSEWGRGSARPRSGVGFMVWIVIGMTIGMIISIGAVLIAYPGIDLAKLNDLDSLNAELQDARAKISEQDEELVILRQKAGASDGSGDSDAVANGDDGGDAGTANDERARALEAQNVDLAEQLRILTGRLEVAQQVTDELQAALDKAPLGNVDELKSQLKERDKTLAELDAGYAELIQRNNELTAERDKLREGLGAASGAGNAAASAGQDDSATDQGAAGDAARAQQQAALDKAAGDVAALQGQLKERDELLARLDASHAELEKSNNDLVAERDRLQGELAAAKSAGQTGGASATAEQNETAANRTGEAAAQLQAALDSKAGEIAGVRTQLDAANARISSLQVEADAAKAKSQSLQADADAAKARTQSLQAEADAAKAETQSLKTEADTAKADLADREKALKDLDAEISRLAPLEAEVASLREKLKAAGENGAAASPNEAILKASLAQAEAEAKRLQQEIADAQAKLKSAGDALRDRDRQLAESKAALSRSEAALASASAEQKRLEAEVARLAAVEAKAAAGQETKQDNGARAPERALTPRDYLLVAKAMQETAGLDGLDAAKRDRLATGLIEGECVAKSLADVFGRAPGPTLRDLIEKLQSDC